jgi:hypothetical protein
MVTHEPTLFLAPFPVQTFRDAERSDACKAGDMLLADFYRRWLSDESYQY